MKTKYTPGPWEAESTSFEEILIHTKEMDIANVYVIDIETEEGEANAKLIAAAPELAEALRDALYIMKSKYNQLEIKQSGPVWDKIYSALNKAGINI